MPDCPNCPQTETSSLVRSNGGPHVQHPRHDDKQPEDELQIKGDDLPSEQKTILLDNFIHEYNEDREKHQVGKQIRPNMNKEFNVVLPIDCKELAHTSHQDENNA